MTCRLLEWLVFTFIFSSAKTHVVVMEVTGSVPAQLDHVFPSPPPFDIIGTLRLFAHSLTKTRTIDVLEA